MSLDDKFTDAALSLVISRGAKQTTIAELLECGETNLEILQSLYKYGCEITEEAIAVALTNRRYFSILQWMLKELQHK